MSPGLLKVGRGPRSHLRVHPDAVPGRGVGASTPFLYFTDHEDPGLGRAVSEGRRREFASFGWDPSEVPDPQAAALSRHRSSIGTSSPASRTRTSWSGTASCSRSERRPRAAGRELQRCAGDVFGGAALAGDGARADRGRLQLRRSAGRHGRGPAGGRGGAGVGWGAGGPSFLQKASRSGGDELHDPRPLGPGASVAVVSPSFGAVGAWPHRARRGTEYLRSLGLEVKLMPNAARSEGWVSAPAEARAEDIHAAFSDPEVASSSAASGAPLEPAPHLDFDLIRSNPKWFQGFSDTTVLNWAFLKHAGLASFYGPSLTLDLAEYPEVFPYVDRYLRAAWFGSRNLRYEPSDSWTEGSSSTSIRRRT